MSPTARSASARPPARRGRKAPPATVVLLVRHGVTPTTGKMLPGQAPGLHLSEKGHEQAGAAAGRIAALAKGQGIDLDELTAALAKLAGRAG